MDTKQMRENDKYVKLSNLSNEIKGHETAVSDAKTYLESLPKLTALDARLRSNQQEIREQYERAIHDNENAAAEKKRLYEALQTEIITEINNQNARWDENKQRHLVPAEEEHVPEPEPQPGLFTRFARWIKNKFSSATPVVEEPAPVVVEEPETIVEEPAPTPSEIRQNKLAELEAKEKEYREEALRNEQEEKQLIQDKYEGKRPKGGPIGTQRMADLDLYEIRSSYIKQEWSIREFDGDKEVIKSPYSLGEIGSDSFEKEYQREITEFFTILENEKNITEALKKNPKEGLVHFDGGVSFSNAVKELLSHRDDEHIKKVISTLLDFTMTWYHGSYPLEAWSSEERLEHLWHMESIMDRVRHQRILAEKFLIHAASDSLKEEIKNAIKELDVFEEMAKHIGGEAGPFSYKEYNDKTIAHLAEDKEHSKYRKQYDSILEYTQDETAVPEYETALSTMMDETDVKNYIEDVLSFAVLTKNGRARLVGNETPDKIIAYGLDDMMYYKDILHKTKLVKKYGEMHPEGKTLDAETRAALELVNTKASALRLSLSSRLKNNGDIGYAQVEANSVNGMEDKFWYVRQLGAEMDKYEEEGGEYYHEIPEINMYEASKKKQDKYGRILHVEDEFPQQMITNYQKLLREYTAGNIDYSSMTRRQRTIFKIGGIYAAKIYGPKSLYEKMLKSVSSRFDDDGLCSLVLLLNDELKKNNSMEDNSELYQDHMNDSRVLTCYIDGYCQNENGEPLNSHEEEIKTFDAQRIKAYETDDEYRISEIKSTINNLLDMENALDPDWLTLDNIIENFYFVSEIGMRGMMIMNQREDPRNAEYFDKLSEAQIEEIKLHVEKLCTHMNNLVAIYTKIHSYSAQQGYNLYSDSDLESFGLDTLEEQYKVQLQAIIDILNIRKKENAKKGKAVQTVSKAEIESEEITGNQDYTGSEEIYL